VVAVSLVHSILSSESDISTHSEGNEPHRYLVVELKN
jgi:spoIIIJ-associated protein